ncbi:cytochrome b/b6 domain-containing protein [Acidimangrovimonas sediminis]|uniref:cytochrome b/b6 domain-containing protein n=1 Tax=Acidimangrovimonas sediminis TaxID=2056283 RepID=UPI000C8013FF|nr:cytochrome b/b6 domain-containing protein [Acidimangrovimonas sediminis]
MNARPWPRTDIGTVLLHWSVAGATVVLLLTGLRITSDDVGHEWLRALDGVLMSNDLWTRHILAAQVLTAAAVGYAIYLPASRLTGRIHVDRLRLKGLFGTSQTRWSCLNALICWGFLIAASGLIVTGWLAYVGAPEPVLDLHLWCTWAVVAFVPLHLYALLRLGGFRHLARMFRPRRLAAQEGDLDLAVVVSELLAEREAARGVQGHGHSQGQGQGQARPSAASAAARGTERKR